MRNRFPILVLLGLLPIVQLPAAITVTFNGSGRLSVSTTAGEACVISVDNGLVKINGADPDSGALMTDALQELSFNGDDGNNTIDLSAITVFNIPNFTQATIYARGGDDTLLCTDFRNTVDMGPGNDSVSNFGSDFTLYDWSPGDGTESIVNDGTGTVRLRYQGSTGADQIALSSPGENVLQLTATVLAETISFENLTDIGLQMGDGNDIVDANDLSSVNWSTPILCNKNGGSLDYNGQDSNQAASFFLNGASTQISVTPNSGSSFSQNSPFTATPFDFSVTKSGDAVRISYVSNTEVVHLLSGFSTISISGTSNDDTFTIENVGSESLESIQLNGRDGSDTVNAVFQTSTTLIFNELSPHSGSDTLSVDAEGKPVLQTASTLETPGDFGDIEFSNVENVVILNALETFIDQWTVK